MESAEPVVTFAVRRCSTHLGSFSCETLSYPETFFLADLAGQFIHQSHYGILEECGCGQRSLGDLCDAQMSIWPHVLQHGVGALREKKQRKATVNFSKAVAADGQA